MVLKKLLSNLKNLLNRKSVMKSWLMFYIALIVGLLLLVLWVENIFFNVIVDKIIILKTEEVIALAAKWIR